jgi:hypothetical protein
MSALGHEQTFAVQNEMSALHPKADMCGAQANVRYVPEAGMHKGKAEASQKQRTRPLGPGSCSRVSTKSKSIVVMVPVFLNDHDLGIVIAPITVIAPSIVMAACPPTMKAAIVIAVSRDNHCSILRICAYGW